MNVPSFLTDLESTPTHADLTRGFGNVVLDTFQQADGKLVIDIRQTTAAMIDSLGSVLAFMPITDSKEGRRALIATVMADLLKVIEVAHSQPTHLFTGATVQ